MKGPRILTTTITTGVDWPQPPSGLLLLTTSSSASVSTLTRKRLLRSTAVAPSPKRWRVMRTQSVTKASPYSL